MVDSAYSTNIYKSVKISIGKVMRNPETLKFVPDHLKTKLMCKHPVNKLPFLIRCVPDQYKIQQMCDKAILEFGGTLKSISDRCVINLLKITLMHQDLFVNAIRLDNSIVNIFNILDKRLVSLYLSMYFSIHLGYLGKKNCKIGSFTFFYLSRQ